MFFFIAIIMKVERDLDVKLILTFIVALHGFDCRFLLHQARDLKINIIEPI